MTPAATATRRVTGWRLAATCALLVGLAFVQDAGLVLPDTKLDLVLDPGRFVERALHLWDPTSALGQLQNQAYGYLWPMGPFFWVGDLLGAPGWAVQRGWWSLVLCTAFVGAALVTRALGVRSDLAVVVAGLAYALSPRMLTVLGPISIEAWPSALAPWVLLPLVVGASRGDPRRAAALSALAVSMVGGVNAAATAAVLPLGALWLLTRERGPRRRSMLLWWPALTALGTLWWLVPLFTLGAYSPPFLDVIESAAATTSATPLFDALRGTSNWVPYVSAASVSGRELLVEGHLAVMSAVVLALGLAGLLDRRQPHRWFLGLGVLTGLLLVTMGHQGPVQGLLADPLRTALDGALAPVRNVHKFDPVLRLPLVVGLGWSLQRLLAARPTRGFGRTALERGAAVGVALLAVVLAATPALAGRLAPLGAFAEVPAYWQQAATWLEQRAEPGTALLVPGASFGEYTWGSPRDEPMQALARSDWAVRSRVPLAPMGGVRALDRIETAFAQGQGSPALTAALRRAGVRWLVVRGDLRQDGDIVSPALVRQALAASPDLRPRQLFGPPLGASPYFYDDGLRAVVEPGWALPRSALEVWEVVPAPTQAGTTATPAVVAGGPEDVPDLEELGVVGDGAAVLAPDASPRVLDADPTVVLTDGLRQRERDFTRINDGYGPVTLPGDVRRTLNPLEDYLDPDQRPWRTTATLTGVAAVSASTSASDATAFGGSDRGRLPYAALDGDATTQWSADLAAGGPDDWEVRLLSAERLGRVTLTGGTAAGEGQRVRLRTDDWVGEPFDLGPAQVVAVDVGGGPTRALRVEQVDDGGAALALAEVDVPGVTAGRRLDLPRLPQAWGDPDVVVLRADLDARQGCLQVADAVRCAAAYQHDAEEAAGTARRFALQRPAVLAPELWVRPRAGKPLADLVARGRAVYAETSSTLVRDPRASATAAIDGDPGTAWVASPDDPAPTLRLSWLRPQTVTGLTVAVPDATLAARPTRVLLRWVQGGRERGREVRLDDDGRVGLPTLRTQRLDVVVQDTAPAVDLGAGGAELPAGIAELTVEGAAGLPAGASRAPVRRACGTGPTVTVDGVRYPTSLVAADDDLLTGARLRAGLCSADGDAVRAIEVPAGDVDVTVEPGAAVDLDTLVLRRTDGARTTVTPGDERVAEVRRTSTGSAVLAPRGAGLLAERHNANPGWDATGAEPVVADGWRQGWWVPEAGEVRTSYGPDATYRAGLVVGAAAFAGLLAVVALLVLRPRRRRALAAPVGGARVRGWWAALAAAGAALLLAGWPGLLLSALVAPVLLLLRRGPTVVGLAPAGAVLVASAAYLDRPLGAAQGWAGSLAWPAYATLVAVVAVLLLASDRAPGARRRSRWAGRSTSR